LRSALASWLGSSAVAESVLVKARVDPKLRGEALEIASYCNIADAIVDLAIEF
jgi:16S rRNA (adenine1518-N6/adenine1519-N6)-dimethyltransferase